MKLIENLISLLVGLSIFIVGMNMMSSGLKKVSGHGIKSIFEKTQKNNFIGVGIGLIVTAIIQSSSATSIMTIGFMNAGIMSAIQGISIMMGAFIGTTVTGLIVSLSSFSISIYLTLFAFIGLVLSFFKKDKTKHIGEIFTGFGILFFGLELVSGSFKNEELTLIASNIFQSISFPLLLLLAGILFTALLQSSSASISIFIVMVGNNVLSFESAMFLTIGATVGALVPIVLSVLNGNVESKRAVATSAFIRIINSIIYTVIIWPFASKISSFFASTFGTVNNEIVSYELALAMFSLFYNVISLLIFAPFINKINKLFTKIIKDKSEIKQKSYIKFIDDRFVNSPGIAIMQVKREIENMAHLSLLNFKLGYDMIMTQDISKKNELEEREEGIDYINNEITQFLIKISNKLDSNDEKIVGSYFHVVNDIERIGDHANNFLDTTLKMIDKNVSFSEEAHKEIKEMYDIIIQMFNMALNEFDQNDTISLNELHNLEERTDELKNILSSSHYERIIRNECKTELSPFFTTFVSELERIADHLTNIGYSIVNPTGDETIINN